MANTLMFEVGIKSAQEQLDKIKQEFTKANGDLSKLLNIKVSIDGVDAVTKALSQIGDTSPLRNLRNEIAALNREFSILSKGAGGSGDIAGRGLAADIERTSQSIDRYTSKIKQLTEERTRLVGGTRNSSYQNFTDEIDRYEQSLEGARKKLAQLNEQKNQSVASEPLKKSTQDAQAFETALGRIETAIGGLKSGMSVNLTGDFSKWAQEVQNVTASVRELVEQLQKITTPEGLKTFTETAQSALSRLREEAEKIQNTFGKFSDRAEAFKHIQNSIGGGVWFSANGKQIDQIEHAKSLIRTLNDEKTLQKELNELRSKYPAGSLTDQKLSDFRQLERTYVEIINLLRRVREEEEKMGKTSVQVTAKASQQLNQPVQQGSVFDPQKFNTLQEAIDKIISEINRLQQAFTKLGENSSLSNLSTMINGLAVTLSTLSNAIKIQPLDEQVKALLERCEKAEAKLREVGDAAKYLNERAGAKTQQKAGTIMDITGTEAEQLNKVSSTAERFMRLLVEIENQMTKIGKIQALGEQSGFSPTLLKNAQTQLEALKKMVESTIKGTPIAEGLVVPASNSQLAQFIQQFGLLKAQYRDIITEADKFNKANEKDSLRQKSEELKTSAANMKAAENESRRLTETISNLEALASKAGALGIDTSKIRNVIDNLRALRSIMDDVAKNNSYSTKELKLEERFFKLKRMVKDVAQEIKKDMTAALKPNTEQSNAFKEYISLLKQISSLTNTANRGAALGLDVQTLRNQIALLEQYAKKIEQFANNKGVGFNAWIQATPVYGEARMNIAADQAKMNTAIANAKQTNTHATAQLSESEQNLASAIKGSTDSMRGQSQVLSDLKMMAMQYLSVWGAQSFISSIIETGGQLEQQRLSLSAILGDMEKASTLFGQIKELALKSPFGVVELDKMSKQLAAYSFEYEELFDWTKRLADISAATGTSVDRLALALGHVRSEGALSGYTLRQFAMANVPVLRMLSENMGISSKEVRERVKKKEISAEDVQDILKQLTEDGGMFANAQETMSEALNAKFKNLRDAFDIMYGEIAEGGVGDKLKELAVILTQGAKHWERLGKDVLMVAAALGMGKVAMLLYNKAVGEGTAATLKSAFAAKEREVANLKLAKSYRTLTIEEEAELAMQRKWWSFGSKLNSRNIMVLLSTNKLTVAQLERAVAMGKVSKADAIAAMNLLKLNTVQMQSVKVFGFWGRIGATISNGFRMAGLAVKSFAASVAPLLALTALFELWNRRSEQKDSARTMSSAMAGVAPGREAFEIRGTLANSNKLSEEALKSNIEEMKNALIASNAYTDSLRKQVDATNDAARKYDILKEKIGEVADKYEELKSSQEKMLEDAWDAGGGYLSDNMAEDAKDYDAAFVEYTKALTVGSKQIREALKEWMEARGLFKEGFADMTGKQLFEQLSSENQQSFLTYGWNAKNIDVETQEIIRNISRAYAKVGEQLAEMKGKQGQEFSDTLKAMYEEAFHVDLDKATDEQKIAFDKWLRETIGRAEGLSRDAKEALRNIVIDFTIKLVPHYQIEKPQTAQDVIDQQIGDNKWLSGFFGRQNNSTQVWTVETAQKEVKKYKKLFGDISLSNLDTAPKKLNSLLDGLEETKKNLQNTLSNGLLSTDEKEDIEKSLKDTTDSIDLVNKALKDVGGKRHKKGDKSGNKNYDTERAKAVREQVRIIKEAADAFQYWREKVGDKSAWEHVQSEFGEVLKDVGITAKNIEDVRSNLDRIPTTKKFKQIKDEKIKREIKKEIGKEQDQYNRKDFERDTEKFLSETEIKLDSLTRAWEKFNTVREATGNLSLAINIAGVKYQEGQRTLADAVRQSVEDDFKSFGVQAIPFSVELDKESIKRQIQEAFAAVAPIKPVQGKDESAEDFKQRMDAYNAALATHEARIKGVVTEYEKWQELQKQIEQADLQVYANLTGSAVDLTTELQKINDEYLKQLDSLNRLKSKGVIKQDQYNQSRSILDANTNMKLVQAKESYKLLVDGVITMNKNAARIIKNEYADALEQQLKAGAITAKDYADKIDEINKKMNDLENSPSNFKSFMEGGLNGLIQNLSNRGKSMTEQGASLFQQGFSEKDEKGMSNFKKMFQGQDMMKMGKNMSAMSQGMSSTANTIGIIIKALDDFAKGLRETFETMRELAESAGSDTHTSSWNTWDTMTSGFSRTTGNISKAWNGIQSGDIGAVLSGAVGTFVSPIIEYNKGHDRLLSYRIEDLTKEVKVIESDLAMIKRFRERNLGYDTGEARKLMSEFSKHFASYTKKENLEGDVATYYYGVLPYNMANYYNYDEKMNGYMQELEDLRSKRDKIAQQYSNELDKKNSSDEALREYQDQISELDEQIMYFTQDLSKELWDIDFKSWATQFSDALWTAFENGEDAAQAFHDTAEDIIADVAKRMMTLSILEPMFNRLQKELFGEYDADLNRYVGGKIKYDTNGNIDMEGSQQDVLAVLGKYFGEGGEAEKSAEAANMFYDWVKEVTGFELKGSDSSSSSTSNTIKGITEQTADLIASYISAIRLDVSVNRAAIAQYFPLFYQALTSHNSSLTNIENNTAAIMRSNETIANKISSLDDRISGLQSKTWKVPIA